MFKFTQINADVVVQNRDAYFPSNSEATADGFDIQGVVLDASTGGDTDTEVGFERSHRATSQLQLRVRSNVCGARNSTCLGSANIKIN